MPRPLQVDLGPFDLESGVRVMCDVGYLCANFSLPRPLCSRLTPDVCDRRLTSDAHHRLMPPYLTDGGIIRRRSATANRSGVSIRVAKNGQAGDVVDPVKKFSSHLLCKI